MKKKSAAKPSTKKRKLQPHEKHYAKEGRHPYRHFFATAAERAAELAGSTQAFAIAVIVILVWAATGPIFGFSDTWQIVINTATTIITFLLVFLIQNSQNRDTHAIHLKLDELIRCTEGAHTVLLDLEKLDDQELKEIHCRYQALAEEARKLMRQGKLDTGVIAITVDGNKGDAPNKA